MEQRSTTKANNKTKVKQQSQQPTTQPMNQPTNQPTTTQLPLFLPFRACHIHIKTEPLKLMKQPFYFFGPSNLCFAKH
jgi:hypothetical protein